MIDCSLELNSQPMSTFKCGAISLPAFSGLDGNINRRSSACIPGSGPIPPGTYHIFDRQSGGLLGPLKDLFTERDDWFTLYAVDGKIDDETFCNAVKRGNFRLHPKGRAGISYGCIVIDKPAEFQHLRTILKRAAPVAVTGSRLQSYGRVIVK